mmetsp:Transcript_10644/g.25323  ORF Transcript_10644/g.25323 Transcript_10644/m.25323 type:complete len:397 (-) Transcript_10644:1545-2735(-)
MRRREITQPEHLDLDLGLKHIHAADRRLGAPRVWVIHIHFGLVRDERGWRLLCNLFVGLDDLEGAEEKALFYLGVALEELDELGVRLAREHLRGVDVVAPQEHRRVPLLLPHPHLEARRQRQHLPVSFHVRLVLGVENVLLRALTEVVGQQEELLVVEHQRRVERRVVGQERRVRRRGGARKELELHVRARHARVVARAEGARLVDVRLDVEEARPLEQVVPRRRQPVHVPRRPRREHRRALGRAVGALVARRHPELRAEPDEARGVRGPERARDVTLQHHVLVALVRVQDRDAGLVAFSPPRGALRGRWRFVAHGDDDGLDALEHLVGLVVVVGADVAVLAPHLHIAASEHRAHIALPEADHLRVRHHHPHHADLEDLDPDVRHAAYKALWVPAP